MTNVPHEHVLTNTEPGALDEPLLHHPYATISEYFDKLGRYSRTGRRGTIHVTPARLTLVARPPARFVDVFWRGGWRDGGHGIVISLLAAMSVAAKYAHLWALQHGRRNGTEDHGSREAPALGAVRCRSRMLAVLGAVPFGRTNSGTLAGRSGLLAVRRQRNVVERQIAAVPGRERNRGRHPRSRSVRSLRGGPHRDRVTPGSGARASLIFRRAEGFEQIQEAHNAGKGIIDHRALRQLGLAGAYVAARGVPIKSSCAG
jgi:hypothetical protein